MTCQSLPPSVSSDGSFATNDGPTPLSSGSHFLDRPVKHGVTRRTWTQGQTDVSLGREWFRQDPSKIPSLPYEKADPIKKRRDSFRWNPESTYRSPYKHSPRLDKCIVFESVDDDKATGLTRPPHLCFPSVFGTEISTISDLLTHRGRFRCPI